MQAEHFSPLNVALIDTALADIGAVVRRANSETLTEEEFHGLMGRARKSLLDLRGRLDLDVEERVEAADVETLPNGLVLPKGVQRARTFFAGRTPCALIDGGLATA